MNEIEPLFALAAEARERAYAPYSGYSVGCAVEGADGRTWSGCNVENVSYGATLCAERVAVFKMVSDGCRTIRRVAVLTKDGGTPCGLCLQVLLEFGAGSSDVEVWTGDLGGGRKRYRLNELLPHGFRSDEVNRTERPNE
jgi:cytidine deaminase